MLCFIKHKTLFHTVYIYLKICKHYKTFKKKHENL
jgi:hypothetical protein